MSPPYLPSRILQYWGPLSVICEPVYKCGSCVPHLHKFHSEVLHAEGVKNPCPSCWYEPGAEHSAHLGCQYCQWYLGFQSQQEHPQPLNFGARLVALERLPCAIAFAWPASRWESGWWLTRVQTLKRGKARIVWEIGVQIGKRVIWCATVNSSSSIRLRFDGGTGNPRGVCYLGARAYQLS